MCIALFTYSLYCTAFIYIHDIHMLKIKKSKYKPLNLTAIQQRLMDTKLSSISLHQLENTLNKIDEVPFVSATKWIVSRDCLTQEYVKV